MLRPGYLGRLLLKPSFSNSLIKSPPLVAMALVRPTAAALVPTATRNYGNGKPKLQFPQLPKQWEARFKPGQMYLEQDSLPKLPVPPLKQTLERYLLVVQPLLTAEEFEQTKKAVAEFGRPGGVGEELQRRLLERSKVKESWLLEWWNHVAYLGFRESVMVNSNPAIGFPRQPSGSNEIIARNAADFLLTCVKWNLLVQNEALPVDYYRKRPMCMFHYDLYSKCRIPGPAADSLRTTPIQDSRHVIVIRNGYFYKLEVLYYAPDGTLSVAPSNHIISELLSILETTPGENPHPVGMLTNEHRDTWHKARETLRKDPVNQASLEDIETCIFTVSLDKAHPHIASLDPGLPFDDHHKSVNASNYLHGNGSEFNSGNRWSDTCIQVCVTDEGGIGSLLEHSGGDGVCATSVDVFKMDLQSMGYDVLAESSPVPPASLKPAQRLKWNLSPESVQDIRTATINTDKLAHNVDLRVVTFTDFGKNFPKKYKISPDGFMQTAIQLAYWKMYNKTASMYESGATRFFKKGRTDTIRAVSNTSHQFLKATTDPTATMKEKADLLVASVKAHSHYTQEAISGQAVDRHLLGLRLLVNEVGMELPAIFTDPAYGRSAHIILSTSQVPVANYDILLCFGAVTPDGYGVCYNPQENKTLLAVSSFRSCPETDSALYIEKLKESLREMRDVVVGSHDLTAKL